MFSATNGCQISRAKRIAFLLPGFSARRTGACADYRSGARSIARDVKTVLFVGAGRHQRRAILRAKELGLRVVAVDRNPDAPGLAARTTARRSTSPTSRRSRRSRAATLSTAC